MKIHTKIITMIQKETNLPRQMISDYINRHRYPSRKRAILLEEACSKVGINLTKEAWIFSSREELKNKLSGHI